LFIVFYKGACAYGGGSLYEQTLACQGFKKNIESILFYKK